jgi:hypothetical protein
MVLGMVVEDSLIPMALIQERITSQIGYKTSYRKVWKAKQKSNSSSLW